MVINQLCDNWGNSVSGRQNASVMALRCERVCWKADMKTAMCLLLLSLKPLSAECGW